MAKLYVGNLSPWTTETTVEAAFLEYGKVLDTIVVRDRDTGRSRRFGFVTMSNLDEANAAITGLNGQDLEGSNIVVKVANASSGQRVRKGFLSLMRRALCVHVENETEK